MEASFPRRAFRSLVERAELLVVVRRRDEDETASRDDRSAVVLASRVLQALGDELRILPERNLPGVLARVHVDGIQRSPWRSNRRIPVDIEELVVSRESVLRVPRHRLRRGRNGHGRFDPISDVRHDRVGVVGRQRGEPGHAAGAVEHNRPHFGHRHLLGDIHERWNRRRRARPVIAVARRALAVVEIFAADGRARFRILGQGVQPHHLVRIDVQAGRCPDRTPTRPTPLRHPCQGS